MTIRSINRCATCGHPKFEHAARINGHDRHGCRFKGCYCPSFVLATKPKRPPRPKRVVDWIEQQPFPIDDERAD